MTTGMTTADGTCCHPGGVEADEAAPGGTRTIDRATRWPLYLVSFSEFPVVALGVLGQPGLAVWESAVLLLVTLAHAAACLVLLRAGLAHYLGGPRPSPRWIGAAIALTAVGVGAAAAIIPGVGRGPDGSPHLGTAAGGAALIYCAAVTGALAPLLPTRRLLAVVVVPAVAVSVLQTALGGGAALVWGVNYLLAAGAGAATYRPSVWLLGLLWEMERARDVQARLAVAEERLRFARDLHDTLGRNLSLIAVNSDLAAQLARRGDAGADARMLDVRHMAQESMRELREVVSGYRTADLDAELAGARSVLRSAGIATRVIGESADLPAGAQTAFGWAVREAVTNILRHSEPTTVRIDLSVDRTAGHGATAVLRIENDGARVPGPRAGSGLRGLSERLGALGGTVTAEGTPDGRFVVAARVPIP